MRKALAIILTVVLACMGLPACSSGSPSSQQSVQSSAAEVPYAELPNFSGLNDPALLQYTQDSIASKLDVALGSDDYKVEDVYAIYVSKEYLDELEYNNKANIYFGYTLEELQENFGDQKYIFTLGEDGQTTVKAFENYDDTYDQIVRNVAIGSGVILICVVVTVATGGAGAPAAVGAVHAVFATSAKSAAIFAVSSGALDGAINGIATGIKTGDMNAALKSAALSGSEGFKWGAMIGAATGGASEVFSIAKAARAARTWQESEAAVQALYKGEEQVSFLAGKVVPKNTPGATRPDVIAEINGQMTAIEVKNYDLINNLSGLKSELKRQLTQRVTDLPEGWAQRVVVDIKGKGYSAEFAEAVLNDLKALAHDIDPTIVVEFIR